jgi:DnaJ family protein C protein 3
MYPSVELDGLEHCKYSGNAVPRKTVGTYCVIWTRGRGSSTWSWHCSILLFAFTMPPPLLLYCLFILLSTLSVLADSGAGSALYPPGLQPLINRANALLSAGTFHDAAKAYSEAIGMLDHLLISPPLTSSAEQSPVDPTLYYKRATAYFSLGRHANALADFDQVLTLTSDSFEKAHLMKAKIHAKEGRWADAREALKHYQAKNDLIARELILDVADGEAAARKAIQAQKAKLWTACEESATQGLRVASHSVALRQQRANCALAAGDFEEAVADLRYAFLDSASSAC